MSFLKLNSSVCVVLVALVLVVVSSQFTFADTTTLVCTNNERPSDPPFTIDLDQSNGTVTYNVNGMSTKYPATFDSKEINYSTNNNAWNCTINRLTGIITIRGTENTSVVLHNTCHVGNAQF